MKACKVFLQCHLGWVEYRNFLERKFWVVSTSCIPLGKHQISISSRRTYAIPPVLLDAIDEYIYKISPIWSHGLHLNVALCFSCNSFFLSCLSKKGFLGSNELSTINRSVGLCNSQGFSAVKEGTTAAKRTSREMSGCRKMRDVETWDTVIVSPLTVFCGTGSAPYSRSTVSLPSKSVPVDRGSGYRVWGDVRGICTYPYTFSCASWILFITTIRVLLRARAAMPANSCQLYFDRALWKVFASWVPVKELKWRQWGFGKILWFFSKRSKMICVWPFEKLQGLLQWEFLMKASLGWHSLILLLATTLSQSSCRSRRVSAKVMFHGATETEQEFSKVKEWIKAEHPGEVSPRVFGIHFY